jgi:uncharacterized protein YutE (UPF0331/DUF86 family)
MVLTSEPRERLVLQRLRDRYEREGYSFYAYPPGDLLPHFLGNYRPDAIALKDNEKIAIEIKGRTTEQSRMRLSEIARIFQGQKYWHFLVFNIEDFDRDPNIRVYGVDEIEDALREVDHLAESGQVRAAFVLGWAALEAAVRALLAGDPADKMRPISSDQISELLAGTGLVEQNAARMLRELSRVRNALVHGDLGVEVDQPSIQSLEDIIRSLVDKLRHEVTSNRPIGP